MKTYHCHDAPIQVCGIPFFNQTGRLERLPERLRKSLPSLEFLGRRCPGARLCFRTNSRHLTVRLEMEKVTPDIGMSIYSCQSAGVYVGNRKSPDYLGHVFPAEYGCTTAERSFEKRPGLEDVMIYFPRNEVVTGLAVGVDDDAVVEPPTPFRHAKPVVFYGSSITEGGCCSKPANAYSAFLSRWLDFDCINLGFSGAARGEPAMADFIATLDMSVFVLDYDHNATTVEWLAKTHEPFFKRIRAAHADLPALMLTRPDSDRLAEQPAERRAVIRATCENARAAGDRHVAFVDGATFYGASDRDACSNDGCHPNDLGMHRIAQALCPVLAKLLES